MSVSRRVKGNEGYIPFKLFLEFAFVLRACVICFVEEKIILNV